MVVRWKTRLNRYNVGQEPWCMPGERHHLDSWMDGARMALHRQRRTSNPMVLIWHVPPSREDGQSEARRWQRHNYTDCVNDRMGANSIQLHMPVEMVSIRHAPQSLQHVLVCPRSLLTNSCRKLPHSGIQYTMDPKA